MNVSLMYDPEQMETYPKFLFSHLPEMSARPSLCRSAAAQPDRLSIAESYSNLRLDDRSSPAAGFGANRKEPFNQPEMIQAELSNTSGRLANRPRNQRYSSVLPSPQEEDEDEDGEIFAPQPRKMASTSFLLPPSPQDEQQPQRQKARYYSYALSDQDKRALARGEMNHNLKRWTSIDLVRYQEARPELVPRGGYGQKEALAHIDMDISRSHQYMFREEKKVLGTYKGTASQSMYDLRVSSASPVTPAPPLSPTSPVFVEQCSPSFNARPSHVRHSSSGDYFGRELHSRQLSTHSSQGSSSSIRIHSSLATEARPFQKDPTITFDSFLAPHVSGKGEVYRGSRNAKKDDVLGDINPNSIEMKELRKKPSRLGRIASMPSLPKRKSKGATENSPLGKYPIKK